MKKKIITMIFIGLFVGSLCADVEFTVASWNMMKIGNKICDPEGKNRRDAIQDVFKGLSSEGAVVLAAQEILTEKGSALITTLLSTPQNTWGISWVYYSTSGVQENGIWYSKNHLEMKTEGLFTSDELKHPIQWTHLKVKGTQFDFTLFSCHLTFKGGNTSASAAELELFLRYIKDTYLPGGKDPDFIIAGDFNMPTKKGNELSKEKFSVTVESVIDRFGDFFKNGNDKLTVVIDTRTSRHAETGVIINNYDHFILSKSMYDIAVKQAQVPYGIVTAAERRFNAVTSDHHPIRIKFKIND